MPRYFFHIHDGLDIVDEQGIELPDLRAARREALRVLGSFFQVADFDPDEETWCLEVTDGSGRPLFALRTLFSPTADRSAS